MSSIPHLPRKMTKMLMAWKDSILRRPIYQILQSEQYARNQRRLEIYDNRSKAAEGQRYIRGK